MILDPCGELIFADLVEQEDEVLDHHRLVPRHPSIAGLHTGHDLRDHRHRHGRQDVLLVPSPAHDPKKASSLAHREERGVLLAERLARQV
ncbi:hypothetical protein AB0P15_30765 [Streptomyces sp. NPDC087917]|uniref:hypothetical protein n=1 Tax=Streptomyces sp. NPDC087917 TaxID=3155060 RepID=UPI0034448DE7